MRHVNGGSEEVTLADESSKAKGKTRKLLPQTFSPISNLIILQVIRQDESAGGVVLPENLSHSSYPDTPQALVIAAGPDCKWAKRGMRVLVPASFAVIKVKHKEVEAVAINENNLLGIVEDENGNCVPVLAPSPKEK